MEQYYLQKVLGIACNFRKVLLNLNAQHPIIHESKNKAIFSCSVIFCSLCSIWESQQTQSVPMIGIIPLYSDGCTTETYGAPYIHIYLFTDKTRDQKSHATVPLSFKFWLPLEKFKRCSFFCLLIMYFCYK